MDKELNLKGLRVTLYLPEEDRVYPPTEFAGISISVDDGGYEQGELLTVEESLTLLRFVTIAVTALTRY